jgi:hypothetical protein
LYEVVQVFAGEGLLRRVLRHLLAQKMTKDELDNYPFVVGVADDGIKPKRKRI